MKISQHAFLKTVSLFSAIACISPVFANDNESGTKEEAKEMGRDVKKGAKKAVRNVKDETCEMVNGKLHCVGQKIKHKVQNGVDEVKDKTNTD